MHINMPPQAPNVATNEHTEEEPDADVLLVRVGDGEAVAADAHQEAVLFLDCGSFETDG
jgi:hypothetical protein